MVHWQLFLKTIFQDGKTVIKKKKEKKKGHSSGFVSKECLESHYSIVANSTE